MSDDDDDLADVEEQIHDMQVAQGVRSAVPDDPTDLPHSADEYYMRWLEHVEGEEHYPNAKERHEALEKERMK